MPQDIINSSKCQQFIQKTQITKQKQASHYH